MVPFRLSSQPFVSLLIAGTFLCGLATASSIEELGEGLDLSILDEGSSESAAASETPALHLFSGIEKAPQPERPELETGVQILTFSKGTTLVTPNAPRIDDAYRQLGEVVSAKHLKTQFPLKVILHADGNVSVGCGISEPVRTALPPGVDISPQHGMKLMGTFADVQMAERSHPPVVEAVVQIRKAAQASNLTVDTSEIYFLPLEPGKVWVGLMLREKEAVPGK